MRRTSLSFLGFLAFVIASACGGASNTDLGSGGGGGGSGGSSGSSGGGSGSGGSSGGGNDAGSTQPDTGGPDVTPGMDSGPVDDAPAMVDVVQPMEGGSTGPAVLCPMQGQPATCMPGDVCCITGSATLGTQVDTCEHQGQPCAGAIVQCASGTDCPKSQVCCGQKDPTGMMYTGVSCRQSCNGTLQVTFCDQLSGTPQCTQPTALNCVGSTLLPGFNVCGP